MRGEDSFIGFIFKKIVFLEIIRNSDGVRVLFYEGIINKKDNGFKI